MQPCAPQQWQSCVLNPPAGKELPGTWCGTDDGREAGGHQQGEKDQVEQTLHPVVADANESVQVVLQQEMGQGRDGGSERVTLGDICPHPHFLLTLCSPRQSSMAVSWCRLVSEELRSCWTPRRSFCGREGGQRSARQVMGCHRAPVPPTSYLSCWEEGQSKLYQALDLDLHSGKRALEDGENLRGGSMEQSQTHPGPGDNPWP